MLSTSGLSTDIIALPQICLTVSVQHCLKRASVHSSIRLLSFDVLCGRKCEYRSKSPMPPLCTVHLQYATRRGVPSKKRLGHSFGPQRRDDIRGQKLIKKFDGFWASQMLYRIVVARTGRRSNCLDPIQADLQVK